MTDQQKAEQQIAEQCAQKLLKQDEAAKSLNIAIKSVSPGHADLTMEVTPQMLNGHKTCHGGYIFTLADCAFAVACNSYNKTAVAASCNISFVRPGQSNDHLTATASETHRDGRNGIYDVTVSNQDNQAVAFFRGKSRIISQTGPLDDPQIS